MHVSMEEKKEEALKRMSTIVDHFHLIRRARWSRVRIWFQAEYS